jgi:hypothetical protein
MNVCSNGGRGAASSIRAASDPRAESINREYTPYRFLPCLIFQLFPRDLNSDNLARAASANKSPLSASTGLIS